MKSFANVLWGSIVLLGGIVSACTSTDAGEPNGIGGTPSGGSGGTGTGGVGGGASGSGGTASTCPQFSKDALPPGVTVLVPDDNYDIRYIVGIVSGQVYFVSFNHDALEKVPIEGGAPTTVGTIKSFPHLRGNDLLYWAEQSGVADGSAKYRIVTAPLDDPTNVKVVADNVGRPEEMIADATHAYFESRTPENIFRVPLSGGAPEILVPGGSPLGTLVKDGFLWWLDFQSNNLERIPVAGGTRERLGEVHFGGPMAGDADAVYWGDTSLKTIEKWTQSAGRVRLSDADPEDVVVADGVIYWTNGFVNGSVRSIRTDGTEPKSLLCGLETPGNLRVEGKYVVATGMQGIIRIDR